MDWTVRGRNPCGDEIFCSYQTGPESPSFLSNAYGVFYLSKSIRSFAFF